MFVTKIKPILLIIIIILLIIIIIITNKYKLTELTPTTNQTL